MRTSPAANEDSGNAWQARGAASWLALAASPAFAVMAWIASNDVAPIAFCASGSNIHRMTAMYVLMSLFHLSPWLKLASSRPWANT
jgi:hypothetical protein